MFLIDNFSFGIRKLSGDIMCWHKDTEVGKVRFYVCTRVFDKKISMHKRLTPS